MGMGRWISSLTHQGKSELNVSYDAEYEEEFGWKLHGDRRTEIVIIWVWMDEKVVKEILNSSLVTDEEFNDPDSWKSFIDQFPAWL